MMKWFCSIFLFLIGSLQAETKVLAFSGSTREKSFNKQLVKEASDLLRKKGAIVTVIDLKDYPMPFYDADVEEKSRQPKAAARFRHLMLESDLILIASPEYNGSVSGVLKNALDWASRDEKGQGSRAAFLGKTFVLMSASPGASGGGNSLEHLRMILTRLGGNVLSDQVIVPNAHEQIGQNEAPYHQNLKKVIAQISIK